MRSKYETNILPNLERIEAWASQGATAKEIAKKLQISESTFAKYIALGRDGDERYQELSQSFARACIPADDNVEAALYKRACGYTAIEVTLEEKLDREGNVHTLEKKSERHIPADPTSAMFWLTNRRRDTWKYNRKDDKEQEDSSGTGVVLLPAIEEAKSSE